MDSEAIRKLRRAYPFKPFRLVMQDGRELLVDKPFYLAISEDGRLMIYSTLAGAFERFGPGHVRDAVLVAPEGPSSADASPASRSGPGHAAEGT